MSLACTSWLVLVLKPRVVQEDTEREAASALRKQDRRFAVPGGAEEVLALLNVESADCLALLQVFSGLCATRHLDDALKLLSALVHADRVDALSRYSSILWGCSCLPWL